MTCYAIQRPDGSIIVDTSDETNVMAWGTACWIEIGDGDSRTLLEQLADLKAQGYKCVRVTVTVEGE